MNKIWRQCIILAGIGVLSLIFSNMAFAQSVAPKTDVSSATSGFMETVEKGSAKAQEVINAAVEKYNNTVKARLDSLVAKAKSYMETAQALKTSITDVVSSTQNAVSAATSVYEDTYSAAVSAVNSVTDTANSTMLGSTVQLEAEYTSLKSKCDARSEALVTELQEKNTELEKNIKTWKDLEAQTKDASAKEELQAQISTAQAEYDNNSAILDDDEKKKAYLAQDSEYADLEKQLQDKQNELTSMAADIAGLSASALSGMFGIGDQERTQKYAQMITENFLGEDELSNSENNQRVLKNRREAKYKDTVYALYQGIGIQTGLDDKSDSLSMHNENALSAQYSYTSMNMQIQMRIDELKVLMDYLTLQIAELRRQTSTALVNFPMKFTDYSKDPSVLNLSDYEFTEDDILGNSDSSNLLKKAIKTVGGSI